MEDHLESLSSKYAGHGAFFRLQGVAYYSGTAEGIRGQAQSAALTALKGSTLDTVAYERMCDYAKGVTRDTAWIASTSKQYSDRLNELEREVIAQQNFAIRDGMRVRILGPSLPALHF